MAIEGNATSSIESAPDGVLEEGIARRVVYINDPKATNKRYEYAGNNVRTSKYTIVSFLPRNLFEQFHRVAYIYFLVIVILNQIPQLAVFGRTASLFPLVFVLVVTAIKDAYEDWGRHRSDTRENNRLSTVVQDGKFSTKKWKAILVGEVIKICENETVPCDIVLLATSDPTGVAYIQTVNLDGESNLKTRYARQETLAKKPELGSITGCLYCEEPNRNIYEFTAYMEFDGVQLPLGPSNIILRGCEVKNTPWVVGVVVYAGQETKAMLNSAGAQSKRSRLEKQMNREVAWLAVFLLAIAFVGGLGMGLWVESHEAELDILPYYVERGRNGENYRYYGKVGEGIFGFLSCIITFQIMVPISLYISMELVRLGQTYFMSRDLELYHAETDTRFQARALNINEDLGQVKYVFSDKTGTLTENVMEFQTATIDGIDYANVKVYTGSEDVDESSAAAVDLPTQGYIDKRKWRPGAGAKLDPRLVYVLQGPVGTAEWKAAHDFMLTLTTCNTVVPSSAGPASEGVESAGAIKYQAESPDEQALVSAAASYGYVLMERNSEYILVSVLGVTQRFDVLGVHEFDSIRKRMSVVLKCPDGTVQVLVKGADTEVLDKVAAQPVTNKGSKHATDVMLATLSHLDRYAREGLRTLVVASKQLNAADLTAWDAAHRKASISLRNRAGMMRSAADLVETNLTLLGATGIEDKLQDGVPETIAALREAGMKVWVLTGDKQETAISIGFSCLLLTRDMEIIIINETSQDGCREAIGLARRKYGIVQKGMERSSRSQQKASRRKDNFTGSNGDERGSGLGSEVSDPLTSGVVEEGSAGNTVQPRNREPRRKAGLPLALVIDGNSLVHALSQDLEEELLELAMACKVVVCCRVAPLQKAGLVSLVKRKTKEITLSVGDGANDVSMIQMADVGVGISGQEGRQAVMASDFAVGQFRFLRRLLLVHGHWNYERLAYMVLYNLYRNAVFVMMLFWFILYTAYSSVPALSEWNLVFYSLIYTSVPTIVAGILDKDVEAKTLLNYPPLYGGGQRGESYNKVLFWSTMLDTLWQSLVLFYAVYLTYRRSDVDVASLGDLWTVAVVVLVNVQLALHVRTWTWIHHVAFWGSVVATFVSILVMDALTLPDLLRYHWVLYRLAATAAFWLDLMLVLILALLPHFFVQAMKVRFWPSDVDIVRAVERQGRHVDMSERSGVELSEVPGA